LSETLEDLFGLYLHLFNMWVCALLIVLFIIFAYACYELSNLRYLV